MKRLMIATLSLITAASSFAQYGGQGQQQRQLLQLQVQQHLRGQNTIPLKKLIKQQHPGVDVRSLKVKAVRVVAKSKAGRGEVVLISGQSASYPQTVGGNPRSFQNSSPRTFSRILIQNPAPIMSQGKLQLELKGNIKIKRVIIVAMKMQSTQQIMINTHGQHLRGSNVFKD